MGDQTTPTIEVTTRQRLISDQSARELAPLLTPNQRIIVSLFATAEIHGLNLKDLIVGLARETVSNQAADFADKLSPNSDPLDIADENHILPKTCRVALKSARANGSLKSFYRCWLAQTVDDRVNWVRHENTYFAAFGRLGARFVICLYFLSLIFFFIIPEHIKMYDEFGLELNVAMKLLLSVGSWFMFSLPILLLCTVLFGIYLVVFGRQILRNYIRRWIPGRWRQLELPKSVMRRKLMAWDLLAFQGGANSANELDWDAYVKAGELRSGEAAVMKESGSMETKAWLLRNMADQKNETRKTRFAFIINAIIFSFHAFLAFFIILTTFAFFSMLLDMMRGLG